MDLQSTFYLLGIIFMTLSLLILVGLVILVFYIKNKINNIHDKVDQKLEELNNYGVQPVKKVIDVASNFIAGVKSSKKR